MHQRVLFIMSHFLQDLKASPWTSIHTLQSLTFCTSRGEINWRPNQSGTKVCKHLFVLWYKSLRKLKWQISHVSWNDLFIILLLPLACNFDKLNYYSQWELTFVHSRIKNVISNIFRHSLGLSILKCLRALKFGKRWFREKIGWSQAFVVEGKIIQIQKQQFLIKT